MKNRIEERFRQLREEGKKAFIPFVTAGDPSLAVTKQLVLAMGKLKVDVVELGVAFSDPLADGPTIQAASQRALRNKVNISKVLRLVKDIRKKTQIPIALMTYYNPVFRFGQERFMREAARAGVDGVVIPDLPPEEATVIIAAARRYGVATIFFLSPTSTRERIRLVSRASTGFIYYVSLTGVTGTRDVLAKDIARNMKLIKRCTQKPVCVGFGISKSAHVRNIAQVSDGVIVGSAIVKEIEKNTRNTDFFLSNIQCGKYSTKNSRRKEKAVLPSSMKILKGKASKQLIKNVSAFIQKLSAPLR